jgi:polyhydroxyalkanoate synthase
MRIADRAPAAEWSLDLVEPRTGQTPRREIHRKKKARLYRYDGARRHRTPLLFVPNLGISRPWIFDLLPGNSFVQYMLGQGFDFYLLDWGVFGPEDDRLTLDECVTDILPSMWRKVLDTSGVAELSVLGYCMGAALAASLAASRPELRLRAFVDLAGPIDFEKAGLLTCWLDKRFFDLDRVVDTLGSVPPALVWLGGLLLRPTMGLSMMVDLWSSLSNRQRAEEIRACLKWVREFVGIPGEFFRQWVRDFYQENRLYRGELSIGFRPACLRAITCPVLAVAASDDPIAPPDSVRALLEAVGSHDTRWVEVPGSHLSLIVGVEASRLWPQISTWLASRS